MSHVKRLSGKLYGKVELFSALIAQPLAKQLFSEDW